MFKEEYDLYPGVDNLLFFSRDVLDFMVLSSGAEVTGTEYVRQDGVLWGEWQGPQEAWRAKIHIYFLFFLCKMDPEAKHWAARSLKPLSQGLECPYHGRL